MALTQSGMDQVVILQRGLRSENDARRDERTELRRACRKVLRAFRRWQRRPARARRW